MKYKNSFLLIEIIQLIFFCLTVTSFISPNYLLPFIIQYLILYTIFIFLSKNKAFILLIGYITLPLLGYLFFAFIREWDLSIQVKTIYQHIISIINASLIYMSAYNVQTLQKKNLAITHELEELKRYVKDSRLLTKNEFEQRSKIIITGIKRRKEEAYKLYFSLEKINPNIQSSLFDTLSSLAVENFRKEYDLVGKLNDYSFVVLLQNTCKKGMDIALKRYISELEKRIDLKENKIVIRVEKIDFKEEREDIYEIPVHN